MEADDLGPAELVDEALDQAAVQAAHQLGMGLGQLAERAVGEADDGGHAVVRAVDRRVEAERVELGDECFEARGGLGVEVGDLINGAPEALFPTEENGYEELEGAQLQVDKAKGAIIVIQEAFGVNDHIQDVTRRVAAAGYVGVAPDRKSVV